MKVAAALAGAQSFTALDWGGRARLGFASGLRARSCSALKAGKGPTAVTTLSKRWAIVEAKAAAISTLGVADTFPA